MGQQPAQAEPTPCRCTPESVAGLDARQEVVIGLSFPYKYFNSNHWFHISEYYVRYAAMISCCYLAVVVCSDFGLFLGFVLLCFFFCMFCICSGMILILILILNLVLILILSFCLDIGRRCS